MSDYITKLPDDIICHLLSLLTVRDSMRARSLSHRWRDAPDLRCVLRFDSVSVFGKDLWYCHKRGDEFVNAVDQFLKTWELGAQKPKLREFSLEFSLFKKYTSSINRWIATVTSKGVETLDLNLSRCIGDAGAPRYALPCHLFHSNETSSLRHLHLQSCNVTLCYECKSWLGSLATLELRTLTLHEGDLQHILLAAVNLTSLTLTKCTGNICYINIHLPCLKKLVIDVHAKLDINCPYLESLDYTSNFCPQVTFSHFPVLRQVSLQLHCGCQELGCYFKVVEQLTTNAPMLQQFYLFVTYEIPPQLTSIGMHCLKTLQLYLSVPVGFDLFTITDVLHASPSLEILHLEVNYRSVIKRSPKRQHPDHPLCRLKEIKFKGYRQMWQEMEFALYLLKNAIALQQMIIVTRITSDWMSEPKVHLLEGIHPTVELIIRDGNGLSLRQENHHPHPLAASTCPT